MTKKKKCYSLHQPPNQVLHFSYHLAFIYLFFVCFVKHSKKTSSGGKITHYVHLQTTMKMKHRRQDPLKLCLQDQLAFGLMALPGPAQARWSVPSDVTAPQLDYSELGRKRCSLLSSHFQPFGASRCFNYGGKGANDSGHMSPFHTNKSPRRPV